MSLQFPKSCSLANTPTPLRRLDNISRDLGKNIWLKSDEQTGSTLSGNKVRKLEYLLADAADADVIITCGGIQSNHCRATAFACAQLGLACHLILRDGDNPGDAKVRDGNLLLDWLSGAEITIVPRTEYVSGLASIFEKTANNYRQHGKKPYVIPTGGSNEVGIWGYIDAARELASQFASHQFFPDAIVCATGSAGTQAGLTIGSHIYCNHVPVYGMAVCDSVEYFDNKIRHDTQNWVNRYQINTQMLQGLSVNTNDQYIGPGYAKGYEGVYQTIKWVAEKEGVLLDPVYTGKAFFGMLEEIKHGDFEKYNDIIFIHTGGMFGVFPHKQQFHHSL